MSSPPLIEYRVPPAARTLPLTLAAVWTAVFPLFIILYNIFSRYLISLVGIDALYRIISNSGNLLFACLLLLTIHLLVRAKRALLGPEAVSTSKRNICLMLAGFFLFLTLIHSIVFAIFEPTDDNLWISNFIPGIYIIVMPLILAGLLLAALFMMRDIATRVERRWLGWLSIICLGGNAFMLAMIAFVPIVTSSFLGELEIEFLLLLMMCTILLMAGLHAGYWITVSIAASRFRAWH